MPRAAVQEADAVAFPTAERIARGDVIISGRGKQARARVLTVVERLDADSRQAAAWILAKVEAAQFRGPRGNVFERIGGRSSAELLPTERAEHARRALHKMWRRLPADQALTLEYRLVFSECEADVAVRLGLSRGQVSRRFEAGLKAVAKVLKGTDRRSGW